MDERTDNLVKLLFLDSVLSRRTEKERAKKCVATTSKDHCEYISYLAEHVHVPKNSFFQSSKREMLVGCLHSANKWMDCSDDPVKEDTMISYCDLWKQVQLISSSPAFMESKGFEPDYSSCNIGVWWDLRSCPLPNLASYSDFRAKVTTVLESLDFRGTVYFSAVCDPDKLDKDLIPYLCKQSISVVRAEQEIDGTKDTSKTQMIVSMLRWASNYVAENNEGGVVFAITGDPDLRFAIREMKSKKFRVVVAHNRAPNGPEHRVLSIGADKIILLRNLLRGIVA